MTPLFHFHNATLRRGGRPVLENLNWQVQPGESWAISGPAGSGKSTLLAALARRLPVYPGRLHTAPGLKIETVPADFQGLAGVGQAFQYYHCLLYTSPSPRD